MQTLEPLVRQIERPLALAIALLGLLTASSAVALPITAIKTGGSGDWEDPSGWSYDVPPTSASIPDNDAVDFFTVRIDGVPGADTQVSLSSNRTIDRLEIGLGDTLAVGGGATLTIASNPSRPNSGQIVNDGTLGIGDPLTRSILRAEGDIALSGSGVLRLSDFATSRIGRASASAIVTFSNGVGHVIEGAGVINLNRIENYGTIRATGTNPLELRQIFSNNARGLLNQGTIEVTGSGGLDLSRSPFTNEGTIRTNAGPISFATRTNNSGLIEVDGEASTRLGSADDFNNLASGVVRVMGAGSRFTTRRFSNRGLIEVLDGAVFDVTEATDSGLWRIGNGSELRMSVVGNNVLRAELNNGTISGPDRLATVVRGNGSILNTTDVDVRFVAPGLDGAGLIEIDGNATIGTYAAEIGGRSIGEYDRIVTNGNSLLSGITEVSLINDFAPALGDRFDLIRSAEIGLTTLRPDLDGLLTLPALADGVLWIPEIADESTTQALRLNVGQALIATWTGRGSNDYMDAGSWRFDGVPLGTSVPTNDSFNLFDVRVDDGDSAIASEVFLSTDATIESLAISSGDGLTIDSGAALRILNGPLRPSTDRLVNDGTITITSDGLGSSLQSEGDLTIVGSGTLRLTGDGQSRIDVRPPQQFVGVLVNEAGHQIEGQGSIDAGRLTNRGTILANGASPLTLTSARTDMEGVLEATGNGRLVLEQGAGALSFSDTSVVRASSGGIVTLPRISGGVVDVRSGGTIETDSLFSVDSTVVSGPVSLLDVSGTFSGGGATDVLQGGRIVADRITYSGGTVRIGEFSEIESTGSFETTLGTIEFDGGTLTSASDIRSGSVSGSGTYVLPGRTLSLVHNGLGSVAPGLAGIGLINVDGSLIFRSSLIAEARGATAFDYDRLVASEGVMLDGGSIRFSTLDGFAPSGGDSFDLITGATVSSSVPLDSLLGDLPTLTEIGAFWVSEIADLVGGSQSLRLLVETARQALWNGGSGDYQDSAAWSYDATPTSATFPSNNGRDIFHVAIDGSQSGSPGAVSLRDVAAIDALRIGSGDRLTIEDGGRLEIESSLDRTGDGMIVNDGEIVVDGALSQASLAVDATTELLGTGTLRLGNGGTLDTVRSSRFATTLVNGADHRIEGGGEILPRLINRGTISANDTDTMLLSGARIEQRGVLEATGAGGLSIPFASSFDNFGEMRSTGSSISFRSITNDGLMEATEQGSIDAGSTIENRSAGRILVSGAGSSISAFRYRGSGGLLQVLDNGEATFGTFFNGGTTRIGQGAVVNVNGTSATSTGTLDLQGGTLRSESAGLLAFGASRIEGSGRIELGTRTLTLDGNSSLAPGGSSEIGEIDIIGNVSLRGGPDFLGRFNEIEIQLAGSEPGQFDVVSIDGTLSIMGAIIVGLLDAADGSSTPTPYLPDVGSVFDIITATQIVDLGGTFTLPELGGGRTITQSIVNVGSNQVLRLFVVPEPNTAILLALGMTVLAVTRRRPTR